MITDVQKYLLQNCPNLFVCFDDYIMHGEQDKPFNNVVAEVLTGIGFIVKQDINSPADLFALFNHAEIYIISQTRH